MYVCMYVCMYICLSLSLSIYIYIYVHIYVYVDHALLGAPRGGQAMRPHPSCLPPAAASTVAPAHSSFDSGVVRNQA